MLYPSIRLTQLECRRIYPSINLIVNTAKAGLKVF
jgi:hypothetical protein